jgi:hypothetical protein
MIVAAFAEPVPQLTIVKPWALVEACIGRFSPYTSDPNRSANSVT